MEKLDKGTLESISGDFQVKLFGEIDLSDEKEDLVIILPKGSGKFFIQIQPLE